MSVAEAVKALNIKHPDKLFIGGRWVAPASGRLMEVSSPITEEVFFKVAEANEADMDRAVAAAKEAFYEGPWPRMSPAERAGYLRRLGEGLSARSDELAHAWTSQMGALFSIAQYGSIMAKMTLDGYADLAEKFQFEEERTPSGGGGRGLLVHEPVGVTVGIVPWNAPLSLAAIKLAPALAAGCTFILKSSPETPIEGYIIAEVAEEIGLPPGVFNLVTADREASEHLINNRDVDKVSFTGSTAAGKRIASQLAGRMARYTMELGGKSAAIVLDDMDAETAVRSLTGQICMNSGQVCAAFSRVLVPKARYNDYVDAFVASLGNTKPGDPYDPASPLGPLSMKRQLERVQGYMAKAKEEGATIPVGGNRPSHLNRGYYFEPTLLANVTNQMTVAQEEVFGPVISLIATDSDEDAIRIANDSAFGLNGAVFTNDNARAYDIARRVRSGTFAQNNFRLDHEIGFGGFKESGVGREGGLQGLTAFLESKTVLLDG